MVLVGNKCDLEEKRVVKTEQGLELAKEFGLAPEHFYESSAKNEINIKEIFNDLVRQVITVMPPAKKSRCTIL